MVKLNAALLFVCALAANAGTLTSSIDSTDGSFSFSTPETILIGSFSFSPTVVSGISSASVTGSFGNTDIPGLTNVTADSDYYVDTSSVLDANAVEVASCDDPTPFSPTLPCDAGTQSGAPESWSYSFTNSDLATLASGFAVGQLYFIAVQNDPGAINTGVTTLSLLTPTAVPEPASWFIAGGGLLGILLLRRRQKLTAMLGVVLCSIMLAPQSARAQQVAVWSAQTLPAVANINGGPWNLSQGAPYSPASNTGPTTSGGAVTGTTTYCNPVTAVQGAAITNPNSVQNPMQPFYFPFVSGRGLNLQGYFDYRPRNIDEAVVAANSVDGGMTWNFQQKVENLTPYCPTTDSNGGSANGNDDGVGHPYVMSFGGAGIFYLLDRRNGHVDSDGLFVHTLAPKSGAPLNNVPPAAEIGPPAANIIATWDLTNYPAAGIKFPTGNPSGPTPSVSNVMAGQPTPTSTALGMTNSYTFPTTKSNSSTTYTGSVDAEDLTVTGDGTDPNPQSLAWRIRGLGNNANNQGNGWNTAAPQYTQGAQFMISTAGYSNIVFEYDWYTTAQGVRDLQAQYTVDGANWTNIGPVQVAPAGGGYFPQIVIDFPALGISGVNNNPNFGVRLVSAYDSSANAPVPATYTAATLSATGAPVTINNNSGNWRFDEINVLGTSIGASPIALPTKTTGLINPDGILAQVPNTYPFKVLYVDKTLNGDYSFPAAQQCPVAGASGSINHDTEYIHLATSTDGVHWTDAGPVNGLNDPTTISNTGIRYMAPNGSLVKLPGGAWGLFFGGGNCLDGDSDGFHAIMYAESPDLMNWTVYNGISNPIATVDPTVSAVLGATQTWFTGRVYNPQALWNTSGTINLIFTGYDAAYSGDISDYRTIGHATLSTNVTLP